MAVVICEQRSDRSRAWFDADVVEHGDGTFTVPAATFWRGGQACPLAAYTPRVGRQSFWLWIEADGAGGADYLLDLTGDAEPASFGPGHGAHLAAWRDGADGAIHVLRSVSDAA